MASDNLEVECPVCDHKIPSDASRCPNCGAEFSLSGVDELERVIQEMDGPVESIQDPSPELTKGTPAVSEPPIVTEKEEVGVVDEVSKGQDVVSPPPAGTDEDKRKDGLFGKLFKKKR